MKEEMEEGKGNDRRKEKENRRGVKRKGKEKILFEM